MSSYQARIAERDVAYAEARRLKQELRTSQEGSTKSEAEKLAMSREIERLNDLLKNFQLTTEPIESTATASSASLDCWCPPEGYVLAKELIHINLSCLLGEGSSGTTVHKGYFGSRSVIPRECAIKKLNKVCSPEAKREIEALLKIDDHLNIVKYYHMEENESFIYLALELCDGNLEQLVKTHPNMELSVKRNIAQQALSGLCHLHFSHLSHRDIKPANALYILSASGAITIKLADLGFARQLSSSTQGASVVARSQGWQPPEVLDFFDAVLLDHPPGVVHPKPADVFSMGLLIFCLFSKNVHPFGGGIKVEPNIMDNNRVNIGRNLVSDEIEDLVVGMITCIPQHRSRASDCLLHPALWEPEKALEFLKVSSDVLHALPNTSTLKSAFVSFDFKGLNWKALVDARLLMHGKKLSNYGSTLDELLRLLRNKEHHFDEIPQDLQTQMGSCKLGVLPYFLGLFPWLLMTVFKIMIKYYCTLSPVHLCHPGYLKQQVVQSNAFVHFPSLNDYLGQFSIQYIFRVQNAV